MKNIQIIDGADNCTYSMFAATDEEFAAIFPAIADIEFIDDFVERVGEELAGKITEAMWSRPVDKKVVQGIHGTLFYQLANKKQYYPTKKESEMVPLGVDGQIGHQLKPVDHGIVPGGNRRATCLTTKHSRTNFPKDVPDRHYLILSSMNPLPNIHDHSLLEYRVDLANRQVTLITLPESARIKSGMPAFETIFDGMEGHRFGPVAAGVIFLDIQEAPLDEFLPAHELEFNEGAKIVGAPAWWTGSVSAAVNYLTKRDVHAFEINSSYGFDGWVLAVSVRQSILKRATSFP